MRTRSMLRFLTNRKRTLRYRTIMAAMSSGAVLLYFGYLFFLLHIQSATSLQLDMVLQQPVNYRDTFLVIPNRTHALVSAFVDDRPEGYGPAIRVLGYGHFDDLTPIYCKIFYANGHAMCLHLPAIVEAIGHSKHDRQTVINAYLCRVSKEELSFATPRAVSLHQAPGCGFSDTALEISPGKQSDDPDRIGVCVPEAAYNNNNVQDWVEFMEMCRILGADFVQVFNTSMTWPLLSKLSSYTKGRRQFLHVVNWTTDTTYPEGILTERTILANDCLYRNLKSAKQLVVVDSNELLTPHKQKNWRDMLLHLQFLHNSSLVGAYMFRTVSYYDESSGNTSTYSIYVPHSGGPEQRRNYRFPQIVTHRLRAKSALSANGHAQLMVDPRKVTSISVNGISVMLPGFLYYTVPVEVANVHCFSPRGKLSIKELVVDSSMDKFVTHLLNAMHQKFYSTSR